jgi:hypothetical protein
LVEGFEIILDNSFALLVAISGFLSQFCDEAQEGLARFGYKLNMKVNFYKRPSFLLPAYLNHVYLKLWRYFLNFGQIMAIENIKKHLICLALLIFIIAFWLFVASKTKAGSNEASRTFMECSQSHQSPTNLMAHNEEFLRGSWVLGCFLPMIFLACPTPHNPNLHLDSGLKTCSFLGAWTSVQLLSRMID